MNSLNNFDKQEFLTHYWQKKPLVIKQGFTDFDDPLDEHDLAGLAEEPNVDSRIVSLDKDKWQVSHGPFSDINQLCIGAWSLLVQSVDHYLPEADQLMRAFDFIPHWRMDDLMVSFSNANAGVGPHLDQYDVFIIQGKGSRRWQVGLPGEFSSLRPCKDLAQITGFTPVIDQVLIPGDIVYIPAGHPHNGLALEDCLNYSIGFRAPNQQELLSSLADYALDTQSFSHRYTDEKLNLRAHSGEVTQAEIQRFKSLLNQTLKTDHFNQWLMKFLSENGPSLDLLEDSSVFYTYQQIDDALSCGAKLYRSPGVKAVYSEASQNSSQEFQFYIQGQLFTLPTSEKAQALQFLFNSEFSLENSFSNKISVVFAKFLSTMIHSGFWYLEDE
ncbi:JmjC domain-containing protein [Paraglaciecola aestuariivivens]